MDRSEIYYFVHKPHRLHDEFNKAFLSAKVSSLRCPRCSQMLAAARIKEFGDQAGIDFEACPSCQGTWFDFREIEKLNAVLRGKEADSPAVLPPPPPPALKSPAAPGVWAGILLRLGGSILRGEAQASREIVPGLYGCRIAYQVKNRRYEIQENITGVDGDVPAGGSPVYVVVHPWLPGSGIYLPFKKEQVLSRIVTSV